MDQTSIVAKKIKIEKERGRWKVALCSRVEISFPALDYEEIFFSFLTSFAVE